MKKLYEQFNDIIIVDSTFKTNRFNMPLVIVIGISP